MLRFRALRRNFVLAAIALAGACGNGTEPTVTGVAGLYDATIFTTTTAGAATNQLARGAELTLVLGAQGTVTGNLHIPADGVNGTVDESMAGTWTLSGSTVRFMQSADTFVRDMEFTYADGTLVGDETFGGTRIQITLSRE